MAKQTARRTRHSKLAEQLSALLAYRNKPEGEIIQSTTNWSTVPANDNNPEDLTDLRSERLREMTPSVEAIMRSVATGDVERNDKGQIIRIGALHFSDGTQTERAYTTGPDGKLLRYDARMPTGAMLDTREKAKVEAGGSDNPQEGAASDKYFAEMFGVRLTARVSAGRNKRTGKSYTADEATAMLADAWANTNPAKVTYTRFPAGLPRAGARIADSFLGMRKSGCAGNGSMPWTDISTALVERETWAATVAYLSERDVEVLDKALEADSLADLGEGGHKRTLERQGKRRLQAANDNLTEAQRKVAA
ncbi:hypothetical protein [Mesorhizobium sp. M00.F.Ca.ET.217.01.1.1]|uniref:hypothetical protein n=1 Tax=Mesorhizobium sp. M00.F.Ca.ET.217.01.1.1 TaxID=2500529 RepID=UPI000FD6F405|nr:hypothetical protein [Mesorhizobium sp. M00.F.Ca.ET.217.01.1.1]TGQ19308.1 hypothetical protein EN860_019445 [Mesorhizobium sp. M00.F.Ca.ET.217.01.1.1]